MVIALSDIVVHWHSQQRHLVPTMQRCSRLTVCAKSYKVPSVVDVPANLNLCRAETYTTHRPPSLSRLFFNVPTCIAHLSSLCHTYHSLALPHHYPAILSHSSHINPFSPIHFRKRKHDPTKHLQMEQYFILGDQVECIDVRQDSQGQYYNQLNDVQDLFPTASCFRVDGKNILFLEDEHGLRQVKKKIERGRI